MSSGSQSESGQTNSSDANNLSAGSAASDNAATTGSSSSSAAPTGAAGSASGGPLSIDRIRELRASQAATSKPADRTPRPAKAPRPRAQEQESREDSTQLVASTSAADAAATSESDSPGNSDGARPSGRGKRDGDRDGNRRRSSGRARAESESTMTPTLPKLPVPSRRSALPSELQNELDSALEGADLDRMLIGDALLQVGHDLEEGQRIQGRVIKLHGEHVFVSLGGPNEGVISILQFPKDPPEPGTQIEVIVRGYLAEEGLYDLTIPGGAVSVADWDDLKEGEVVEAKITGSNAGGLECVVGQVRGFIPASQVTEYRMEDFSEFIDQKFSASSLKPIQVAAISCSRDAPFLSEKKPRSANSD